MSSLHPPDSESKACSVHELGSDHTCLHDDPATTTANDNTQKDDSQSLYIAIEPPPTTRVPDSLPTTTTPTLPNEPGISSTLPPSFQDAQFAIVLRRQRLRPADNSGLKSSAAYPSRFIHLPNTFEFAGWGSVARLKLPSGALEAGAARVRAGREGQVLGQFTASALAGNAVLGSVFYALPAVVAVGGVYSPISLFIATLILFLWRPIMEELAAALPVSGAPYTYILNISTKSFALVSAALLLLDFAATAIVSAATAIVSAATAAAYLAGEVPALPFPPWVGAVVVLVLFTVVGLMGVRESARIALGVLGLHLITMLVLLIASCVHWGQVGSAQLKDNWTQGTSGQEAGGGSVARQIYYGVCLGMLGLTGFECTPSYVSRLKPGAFPRVLRNLHLPSIALNTAMMLLVLALVPLDVVLGGANVLSVLAQVTGGRWLRTWIVVDAIVVLCGGVLTGILAASELLTQLAQHRVLPPLFLRALPFPPFSSSSSTSHSHPSPSPPSSPHIAVLSFALFCGALYASAGARLAVISEMFSLVWLAVMALFPISLLAMRFSRGRLVRGRKRRSGGGRRKRSAGDAVSTRREWDAGADVGRTQKEDEDEDETEPKLGLGIILAALVVAPVVFAGNVAYNPKTAGYFAAYVLGLVAFFSATQNKVHVLRWLYWVYDQYPRLHARAWGGRLIALMRALRRQPVCILVKGDEINSLFHMILYVRKNEETSYLKIIHFYEEEKGIPSELEANAKILDEAFPEITIDLILVDGTFDPAHVAALSHHLNIPQSLMFMTCPGPRFPYSIAELGTRIISL